MELEKLIVRIQGDVADLKEKLKDAKASTADAAKDIEKSADGIKKAFAKIGGKLGSALISPVKKIPNALKGALNKVKGMFEQAFTFGVLSQAVAEFGKKIKSVLTSNEQFNQSTQRLSASIYTAIMPLVDKLLPLLQKAMDFLADLFGKIAQFTATLTGKTIKATTEEAKALEKMSQSGATASFDSLTKLGGQAGNSADFSALEAMSEETRSVEEQINAALDRIFSGITKLINKAFAAIRKAINKIDWRALGNQLGTNISDLVNGIDWSGVLKTVIDLIFSAVDLVAAILTKIDFLELTERLYEACNEAGIEILKRLGKSLLMYIPNMIQRTIESVKYIIAKVKEAIDLFKEVKDVIDKEGFWQGIWSIIKEKAIEPIKGFFKGIWAEIPDDVKDSFGKAFEVITGFVSKVGTAIKTGFKAAVNGIINFINTIINGFASAINFIIGGLNKISFTIPDWLPGGGKKFGINLPTVTPKTIPQLATGGIITKPTQLIAGERGKEAILPLENNTAWMDSLTEKLAGKLLGNQDKITLNIDGRQLGWASINSINKITKQTGRLQLSMGV